MPVAYKLVSKDFGSVTTQFTRAQYSNDWVTVPGNGAYLAKTIDGLFTAGPGGHICECDYEEPTGVVNDAHTITAKKVRIRRTFPFDAQYFLGMGIKLAESMLSLFNKTEISDAIQKAKDCKNLKTDAAALAAKSHKDVVEAMRAFTTIETEVRDATYWLERMAHEATSLLAQGKGEEAARTAYAMAAPIVQRAAKAMADGFPKATYFMAQEGFFPDGKSIGTKTATILGKNVTAEWWYSAEKKAFESYNTTSAIPEYQGFRLDTSQSHDLTQLAAASTSIVVVENAGFMEAKIGGTVLGKFVLPPA